MKRISLTAVCVAALLAGCWKVPQEELVALPQEALAQEDTSYLSKSAVAGEEGKDTETAVERALVWSRKYSESIEKLVAAQQESRDLQEKGRQLAGQLAQAQAELSQTQKELQDANAMLLELRRELQSWKRDVLGFRQEMRGAQQAQLEALTKVLRLLGGEVTQPTTQPAGRGREVARGTHQ